ncbi:MAG: hypothetical protein KY476_24510 [Planctomycetes bacterium]|nr:hypothetical protein [Planctomycetota bacterium]
MHIKRMLYSLLLAPIVLAPAGCADDERKTVIPDNPAPPLPVDADESGKLRPVSPPP